MIDSGLFFPYWYAGKILIDFCYGQNCCRCLTELILYTKKTRSRKKISQAPFGGGLFQAKNSHDSKLHLSWIVFQMLACTVWDDDPEPSKRISLSLDRCNSVALNSQVRTYISHLLKQQQAWVHLAYNQNMSSFIGRIFLMCIEYQETI